MNNVIKSNSALALILLLPSHPSFFVIYGVVVAVGLYPLLSLL